MLSAFTRQLFDINFLWNNANFYHQVVPHQVYSHQATLKKEDILFKPTNDILYILSLPLSSSPFLSLLLSLYPLLPLILLLSLFYF